MNSAFRRSRNFHFMKFFLQPAGIAGGKFDSRQRDNEHVQSGSCSIATGFFPSTLNSRSAADAKCQTTAFAKKRDITEPAHGPFIDGKAFRPPKVAINKRRIKLQGEPIVNFITDDELGDRTVQSLSGRIGDLVGRRTAPCRNG